MKTHFAAPALAIAVFASSTVAITISFDANFDDLKAIPGEGLLSPVGIYKNLNFTNFDVSSPLLNETLIGVFYHSKPNVAFGVVGALGSNVPTISTTSKVKSFSVNSFYYGCYLEAAQGEVALPVACNLTVAGYKAGASSPFVTHDFQFTPEQGVSIQNPPTFGAFPSKFNGLQRITFAISPTLMRGFIIDDLVGSTVS